jgi:hypothetical protein
MMPNNRELAAAFGVLSVAWFLFGHTNGFFIGLPSLIIWTDFVTYLLMLIFTPAVMYKARWTALGAVVAGVIRIIRSILGLISLPTSLVYGPAVALILALVFTYFSFRAYQQK